MASLVVARRGKSRGRSGSARDGPSSSQICFKCGSTDHWPRDCPKMDDGSSKPKKRNLGAYATGAWTCNIPDNSGIEKCSNHFEVLQFLLSKMRMSARLMLHFWWRPKFWCFGLWCNHLVWQRRRCRGSGSKINENHARIPDVDPCGGKSFNFRDGASSKAAVVFLGGHCVL